MNVAWITNNPAKGSALLPGQYAGGAEMADAGMLAHAPKDVTVTTFAASQWHLALGCDRIVIAATDHLTDEAMQALSRRKPLVWVHHEQQPTAPRAELFRSASALVCMSAEHARRESRWCGVDATWNHGWINPDDVQPTDKNGKALWAARNHPQKGLIGARIWAHANGVELTEITDAPRSSVLYAMSTHTWFVFLPKGFDSCPRTLIEAELAGCRIVTNEQAGRRDPGDIRDVLLAQPAKFWGLL